MSKKISVPIARELYFDSARFWLHTVKQADTQTIEDVLALLDWPEKRKEYLWARGFGRGQVFTSAIMNAGSVLAELELRKQVFAEREARAK